MITVVLAACGSGSGDDATGGGAAADDATTTAAPAEPTTTVPPTTAAPTTTEAPTTTAAATTTAAPTTTDPLAAARARAEEAAGDYTGTWTNTTFGSSGPMAMTLAVDGDEIVVDIDLGGFVFGQPDPEPETYRLPLTSLSTTGSFDTVVFGTITLDVDEATGVITARADAVPTPGIASFESTVTPNGDGTFGGTYVVTFDSGDTAEGVVEYGRG